jgi:hypothetical protein
LSLFLYGSDYDVVNSHLNPKYDLIIEDTFYLQGFILGSISGLTFMPSTVTKWDKDKLVEKSLSERWIENVSRPPVWDNDDILVNYVGHSVAVQLII